MSDTSVTGVTSTSTSGTTAAVPRQDQAEVQKDEFLRLLVAELGAQNPLEPMDGTQFVAQLAQFSVLEQIQGLRDDLKQELASLTQGAWSWTHLVSLIGQNVSGQTPDGQAFSGTVTALEIGTGGSVKLKLGTTEIDPEWIGLVSPPGDAAAGSTGVTTP